MQSITEDATGYRVKNPSLGFERHFPFRDDAGRAKALADAIPVRGTEVSQGILEDRKSRSPYSPSLCL